MQGQGVSAFGTERGGTIRLGLDDFACMVEWLPGTKQETGKPKSVTCNQRGSTGHCTKTAASPDRASEEGRNTGIRIRIEAKHENVNSL